ncbi:MAG: hypothetical protein EOM88_00400 [Clostridia bacterium]|nr:hypothetical protein [Clostridia bacterium]
MFIRKRQKNKNSRGKFKKKIKKDYQFKSLNNPFFRVKKNKETKSKKNRKILKFIIFILGILALIYLIFFSMVFKIKTLDVSGLTRINNEAIEEFMKTYQEKKSYLIFPRTNIIFLNSNDLAEQIKVKFKLSQAEVKKKYFHKLFIILDERQISFIWRDDQEVAYSDIDGCLIREALFSDNDLEKYPILLSDTNINYLKDNDCLDFRPEYFQAVLSLNDRLIKIKELKPKSFILSSELNSLIVDLEDGPNIIFNTKEDLDQQIKKLLIIKQERVAEDFLALEYIDLRFGDLIYLK